jgi:hypothetical protein
MIEGLRIFSIQGQNKFTPEPVQLRLAEQGSVDRSDPRAAAAQNWTLMISGKLEKSTTSFRGALLREPGIHNHRRGYGFRVCASGRLSPTYGRIPE